MIHHFSDAYPSLVCIGFICTAVVCFDQPESLVSAHDSLQHLYSTVYLKDTETSKDIWHCWMQFWISRIRFYMLLHNMPKKFRMQASFLGIQLNIENSINFRFHLIQHGSWKKSVYFTLKAIHLSCSPLITCKRNNGKTWYKHRVSVFIWVTQLFKIHEAYFITMVYKPA